MKKHELKASKRKVLGRKVRALRREGIIPGNVFGPDIKSISVQFDQKALVDTIREAGETSLVYLSLEGETKPHPVLIAGYHLDPVTGTILHVDMHEVNLKEKTTATVPVRVEGEAPAAEEGNVLVTLRNDINVEALPTDLPEEIVVDVSGLKEVGDSISAKDLQVDRSKLTLQIEDEELVVTIQEPAKVEEPVPVETEGEEGAEAEAAEGEEGAEGEKEGGEKEQGTEEKPPEAKEETKE